MSIRTRIASAVTAIVLLAAIIGFSIMPQGSQEGSPAAFFSRRKTLYLWYEDAALTEFLNSVTVSYNDRQTRYRVEPKLISDTDYLDRIYKASINNNDLPDIYILGNDSLERAVLTGLAAPVMDSTHFTDTKYFPQAAIDAVTYEGETVAYPLSFETSALLYNEDYLQMMADKAGKSLEDTVPKTIIDIISLSNSFDAPEGVTDIFKWDVSDIFYNYYFIGNYMSVGGKDGDDPKNLDIYNSKVIQCLQVYQQLNSYFAINTDTDDYSSVINDFADGRIVFTVATTGAVKTLRDKIASGDSTVRYGVTMLPDLTKDLKSKPMSVTDCFVVNGYSEQQNAANSFIQYVLYSQMSDFYARTGKAPALSSYDYSATDDHMTGFCKSYDASAPITKLREASNFWMLMENAFAKIWDGADSNDTMHDLYEQLMVQITGGSVTVNRLPDPERIDISAQLTGGD